MVRDISRERGGLTRALWLTVLICLFLAVAASAQPPKAKDASTKPSAAVQVKSLEPADTASASNVAADPALCVKPADAPAAGDAKSSGSAGKVSADDSQAAEESASQSSSQFMKDKLRLSIGGKKGAPSDEPLQCGVDEAGSQAQEKESDTVSSK